MSNLEGLSPDKQTRAFHAMNELEDLGFTAVLHGEVEFPLRKFANERTAFRSPYVSVLGENEGLAPETPVVTREDFKQYLADTDVNFAAISDPVRNNIAKETLDAVSRDALIALAAGNMAWYVTHRTAASVIQQRSVNPYAVVKLFNEYKNAESVPAYIVKNKVHASLLFGFAEHLEEASQTPKRRSKKQRG